MINLSQDEIDEWRKCRAKELTNFLQPGALDVHNEPEPKPDIPTEEEFLAFIRVRKWLGI